RAERTSVYRLMAGEAGGVPGVVQQLVDEVRLKRRVSLDQAHQVALVEGNDVEGEQAEQGRADVDERWIPWVERLHHGATPNRRGGLGLASKSLGPCNTILDGRTRGGKGDHHSSARRQGVLRQTADAALSPAPVVPRC